MVRIERVETFRVAVPFTEPFVVWRGSFPAKEHVLVRVTTDSGLQGWGEGAPFLFYAPEAAPDISWFVDNVLAGEVIGRDPRDIQAIANEFAMFDGHLFAKGAIEMALWDLLGQVTGLPVYRLLGGPVRSAVPITAVLHVDEPSEMAREATELVGRGMRSLKLKIGFGADRDIAMVAAVREAVGSEVRIRVDAEEHYSVKEALAICRRLERFGLELVSQPVARTDWVGMAALRAATEIPLLADEGIHDTHDVMTCVRHHAADMINIKMLKCGGILNSIEMDAISRAAHLPVMVGSMIEAGIGTLAGAHFAMARPNVFSTELCGPLLYADDLLMEPLIVRDGELLVPDRPGLGAVPSEQALERFAVVA